MKLFITVNYGTSFLLSNWLNNIREYEPDAVIVVVDNFKNNEERAFVEELGEKSGFHLIKSENVGYGKALNMAINYCLSNFDCSNCIFYAGNMDIKYSKLPKDLEHGKFVYVPIANEGKRNRNPFLTKLQSRVLGLHKLTIKTQSPYILLLVTLIIKFLGVFPSRIWAVHGSLFCFNGLCLSDNEDVFNANSFLYSEELEFASYMEKNKCEFVNSSIQYEHDAHAATSELINSKRSFLKVWKPSFENWIKRWK